MTTDVCETWYDLLPALPTLTVRQDPHRLDTGVLGEALERRHRDRGGQEVWPLATHDEVEVQIPDVWSQVNNDDRGVQPTGWAPDMSTLMPPVSSTTVPGQNHGQPLQCQGNPRPPSLQLNPHLRRQSLNQSQFQQPQHQPQLQL